MPEIIIGENEYRTGKLDAFRQFHVARRLAPLLAGLGDAATHLPSEDSAERATATLTAVIGPLAKVLASMSDEDCDYVLNECLSVCSRKQGDRFVPIKMRGSSMLQFQDITLQEMMRLAVAVVQENLGSFFDANQLKSTAVNTPA